MTNADASVTAYVRHLIAEWLARDGTRTAAALAKLAGLTAAQISLIRAGKSGVGIKAIRGLAPALGMSLAEIEEGAAEWASSQPAAPPSPDRYPARAHAIDRAAETAGASSRCAKSPEPRAPASTACPSTAGTG
jgi:transcriptional regulator with XRE-family HTH domain